MKRLLDRSRDMLGLVRQGYRREALRAVGIRFRSEFVSYGLRRDLDRPFTPPLARLDVEIRPLAPGDDLSFLDPTRGATAEAELVRRNQLRLLAAGIGTCWIAVDSDGKPCYMEWLMTSRDNAAIRSQWGGVIPPLGAGEALLEGAYTPVRHRGLGIMTHAVARIAEKAGALGVRWVITFTAEDNVPALKACRKAGFDPYVERRITWRLGRRRAAFAPLPDGFRLPYELEAV
jgi:RimJ/RimL family protein N-acetyltransferase